MLAQINHIRKEIWVREIADVSTLRDSIRVARCDGLTIGFVPTLGYLHEGHVRLIERARAENDLVVVSIYVNPTQFGESEDLDTYPRDLERDRELIQDADTDILFLPPTETMYPGGPHGQVVWVDPGPLANYLCGASRPGHFRGVATVVTKLLNMVQPDRTYVGQKDAQQARILAVTVRDLGFHTEVCVVPTVRERDGLALSSRNVYLSNDERRQAAALSGALDLASRAVQSGERDAVQILHEMRTLLAARAPAGRIDYIAVADPDTLRPVATVSGDVLVALAVYFGSARLIDNVVVRSADGTPPIT